MDNKTVHMEPTKEFFLDYFVKDIKLVKAVLELIDNAIDSAQKHGSIKDCKIDVKLSGRAFEIKDNCGGISADNARNSDFRFGNTSNKKVNKNSIGHYGIGMKRAFFKIGNKIFVESTTQKDHFSLFIDGNKWRKSPDWNIEFKESGVENGSRPTGTTIRIQSLTMEAKNNFLDDVFMKELKAEVINTFKPYMKRGITISVNGKNLPISTRTTEKEIFKKEYDKESYFAKVVINKDIPSYEESGWYVYLNDRMVVKADKSKLTGWSMDDAEEFNKFRGYIYVEAKQEGKLPFNTTKDGLDTSNPIYNELKCFMEETLAHSIPKLSEGDMACIKYERPKVEVEKLKKLLNVRFNKNIGEITFDEFIKRNKIKF